VAEGKTGTASGPRAVSLVTYSKIFRFALSRKGESGSARPLSHANPPLEKRSRTMHPIEE
jgi:hypothetical protein